MVTLLVLAVLILIFSVLQVYSRISRLKDKVDQLEWNSQILSNRIDKLSETTIEPSKPKEEKPAVKIKEKPKPAAEPVLIPSVAPTKSEVIPPATVPTSSPVKEQVVEEAKSRTREEWESFIGGKLLNRIGALALIIGLGFFLKYAFDNNWISETVRVLIGALVGFVCLGFAYRTNKKGYQIFSQGLIGAGISILYLSVYASFNFYSLVPQWVAFLLMSCVTSIALAFGLKYDSLAIGLLGWAGGFLTPIMLSTGSANEIGLFTYIALLDVGLLAIVFMKSDWSIIEPLTLAATWILYFVWYFKYYHQTDLIVTVFFISVFWALFFGVDFARLRLTNIQTEFLFHIDAAVNSIIYFVVLYGLVDAQNHVWMAPLTVVLAGIYFGSYWLLKRAVDIHEIVFVRYIFTSIALAVIATAIQYEDFLMTIGWSLEAAALLWVGIRWRKQVVAYGAVALFMLTIIKLLTIESTFQFYPIDSFQFILNERCLALAILAGAVCFGAYRLPNLETAEKRLATIFHVAWCTILFILFTVEISDLFHKHILVAGGSKLQALTFSHPLVLASAWLTLSLPLMWIGSRQKLESLVISAMAILACAACSLLPGLKFDPLSQFTPLLNLRTAAFVLVLGGVIFHYWSLSNLKNDKPWASYSLAPLLYLFAVLLFSLVTAELNDYFRIQTLNQSAEFIRRLLYHEAMILSIAWMVLSVIFIWVGSRLNLKHIVYSSIVFIILSSMTLLIFGVRFVPIDEFTLLLNIRSLAFVLVLGGIVFHHWRLTRSTSENRWISTALSPYLFLFAGLLFIFLSAETNDYFRLQMVGQNLSTIAMISYSRITTMIVVWAALSLLLILASLRLGIQEFQIPGLMSIVLSAGVALFQCFEYVPITSFQLILNTRFLCGLFVFAAMMTHYFLLPSIQWKKEIRQALQIGMIALSLIIVTGETRDVFEQQIIGTQNTGESLHNLNNLKQLCLSGVWLIYSLVLMLLGFWRSLRRMRIIAFVLFGFTILKIFIYDLSYLETLYRIYSFIGLGLILLGVSYAYQRYKDIIFGSGEQKE